MNAEAIFIGGGKPSDSAGYVSSIRADAIANVRDAESLSVIYKVAIALTRIDRVEIPITSKSSLK